MNHNRTEKYSGTVTDITVTVQKKIHKVQDWIRNRTEKNSRPYAFLMNPSDVKGW